PRPGGTAVAADEQRAELSDDEAMLGVRKGHVVEDDVVRDGGGGTAGLLLGLDGRDREGAVFPGGPAVLRRDDGAPVADRPGRVRVDGAHLEEVLLDGERGRLRLPGLTAVLRAQHEGRLADRPGMLRVPEVDAEERQPSAAVDLAPRLAPIGGVLDRAEVPDRPRVG